MTDRPIIYQSAKHRIRKDGDKLLVEVRTNSDGVPWMPKTLNEKATKQLNNLVELDNNNRLFSVFAAAILGDND